ncbi:MAG: glycosyltransferase family 2 protein [Deltaproteobacteria bacterium]|nr:glycosyltransferase family 2 protein [Deltaproteobacteria bacterium]MBW2418175.1 glycosyltransferase family 2 protein [Deltaproteobacteria bacterium]
MSVLIPAWNAEATLGACLRSLLRQRESRWECVVVDDGSQDSTGSVARAFAARDERLRVIATPHRGIVEALRVGLEQCRAPFVARMDADDWMHRERLGLQLAALQAAPELCAVGCHVRLFPRGPREQSAKERAAPGAGRSASKPRVEGTARRGRAAYEAWLNDIRGPEDLRREALVECPVAHPSLFMRREVLDRFPYRDLGWPEDYDLVLRLLGAGESIGIVPRRLIGWRDDAGRLSRSAPSYTIERFTACKAAHLASSFLAESAQYILWGYGDTGRALRKALAEHRRHPSHIVELHPGRLGQRIHGAPVVPPDAIPTLPRQPLIASVAGSGPRGQIRSALDRMGFVETVDYFCAA